MARGKIGLALGAGVARGWAHIGVIRALTKAGIRPDVIAGTSIGAVAGGCEIAGKLDELEEFARSLTRRKVFGFLDFNLAGSGLISGDRLGERITQALDGTRIETLKRKFVAVATEIGTGHEVWVSRGGIVDAMRASYALPGIFRPVKHEGRWLFDGAMVNPIPVSVCRALGASVVIAVNLSQDSYGRGSILTDPKRPDDADDEKEPSFEAEKTAAPVGALKLLHRQFFGRGSGAPGISTVMMEAFNITQDRIARSRLAGDPPDFMISPKLNHIGMFDFHLADELIHAGEVACTRALTEIRETVKIEATV